MKNKIKEILEDETIESIEDKVDKVAKEIALLTIPKDKYNDLSDRVKNLETEKDELQTKYDDLEKKTLTSEELLVKEKEALEKEKKILTKERNEIKARNLFISANIADEKIEDLLKKVVSDDEKMTLDLANTFIGILNDKVEETKTQTTTDLLTGTPKPDVKGQSNPKTVTLKEFVDMSYGAKKELLSTDPDQYNKLVEEASK